MVCQMAKPADFDEYRKKLALVKSSVSSGPIDGNGSGPHDPGMEQRVAKLETDVGEIKAILGRLEPVLTRVDSGVRKLESDVAELKGRVSQLPGSLQIVGIILGVNAAAVTMGTLVIAALKALHIL